MEQEKTQPMDQEALDALMKDCIADLREMGIPVSRRIRPRVKINTRAKKRYGCCYCENGGYIIEVASVLLEIPSLRSRLVETLYHELLHSCQGCSNHADRWKAYAQKVNQVKGTKISRTAEPWNEEAVQEMPYLLQCESCQNKIGRWRISNAVKDPERYRCGKCGGRLVRLK